MILADKIITLRKKAGWSQEELASQLNVTRQSVSKWEGAQSIPDIEKILMMSRLFGVTTDYLLKDEMEETEFLKEESKEQGALRRVTMEEAAAYLKLRREDAPRMALATFLCIMSPVALILLAALSEYPQYIPIGENAASGLGLCILIVMVAVGSLLFLKCGFRAKEFEFLEKEAFETEYGVDGMVREQKKAYRDTYERFNMAGTLLCILSVLPLFACLCFNAMDLFYVVSVDLLLFLVACGCVLFVYAGTYQSAMKKLLEEEEYSRKKKAGNRVTGAISTAYWLIVTAIFLFYTFGPQGNGQPQYSWFIWAVGGVLYAALMAIVKTVLNNFDSHSKEDL